MTQNVDFSSFWSEIYYKTISELHSLSENCVTDEEYTGTNNVKPFTFIEPDLGIYCIVSLFKTYHFHLVYLEENLVFIPVICIATEKS